MYEISPFAIEGEISDEAYDVSKIKPADMIICRYNAPLMQIAFDLFKNNKGFEFVGDDIKKSMLSALKFIKTNDLQFKDGLQKWLDKKLIECQRKDRRPDRYEEIFDCLMSVSDSIKSTSLSRIETAIESVFGTPGKNANVVRISSIHRAKGLEADRVWLMDEHLIGKRAETKEEIKQEENLRYVAYTRPKKVLILSKSPKF